MDLQTISPIDNPIDDRPIMTKQQPIAWPNLRCLPDRVRGIPIARDIFPFAEEIPSARFQENEKPNFLPIADYL